MNQNSVLTYLICGQHKWSVSAYKQIISNSRDNYFLIDTAEKLTLKSIKKINPRYIFFLHWSWKIPQAIIKNYECVCFHMTDVPYGRGGSPLQNLIVRGHQTTKLTALRMTEEFDAGPVYIKKALCLGGNAEEIYIRATELAANMIQQIIVEQLTPIPQSGEVVLFKRRKPQESKINRLFSLSTLHDFIRMLDAEGYPKAFIEHQGFRYEFSRSALYDGRIVADVLITPIEEEAE
ncbi:MAG: methionyl-tRNA formyltransferase [Cyanobacteria bacterium P01_E01_bin.42]